MGYCMILTLAPSIDEAKQIAHEAVKNKLAACVNIYPAITSVYEWKGEICEDGEVAVYIKTQKKLFDEVKECILKNHSYELPAILMIPVEEGLEGYLNWVKENTKK